MVEMVGRLDELDDTGRRTLMVPCLDPEFLDVGRLGLWNAYVTNKANDLKVSAERLHVTRVFNASIRDGTTSLVNVSAFRASRKRFTTPIYSC